MKHGLLIFFFTLLLAFSSQSQAQELIPLESWRTHFSYTSIRALADADDRIYAASTNGFFYVDKASGETEILSELRGFSQAGIAALQYDPANKRLFIGYRSGLIDVLEADGSIRPLTFLTDSPLPGERQLLTFYLHNSILYIGFDAGIVLLHAASLQATGSWLNLGSNGERAPILSITSLHDSIYAVTNNRLIGTSLAAQVNQANYANWQQFGITDGLPAVGAKKVVVTENKLYAGFADGIYRRENSWQQLLSVAGLQTLSSSGNQLYVATQGSLVKYTPSTGSLQAFPSDALLAIQVLESAAELWVGDGKNGLLRYTGTTFERYSPSGPESDAVSRLVAEGGKVLALYGQALADLPPQDIQAGFSVFSEGSWKNYTPLRFPTLPSANNLRGAAYSAREQAYYFASFADGLLRWQPETDAFTHWQAGDAEVSLEGTLYGTLLSDVDVDAEGKVWMLNYGVSTPLHRFVPAENSWLGLFTNQATFTNPQKILVPFSGDAWVLTSGATGIQVANPQAQPPFRQLTESTNSGGLADNVVNVVVEDLDGSIWIGTQAGINYLPSSFGILSDNSVNSIQPVYQERFLLRDETITALAVDGGNRKWIGTRNGLWAFGDFGDTLNYRFTAENSPLPANEILSLAVEQKTGEVFVATPQGVVSFRSASSLGGEKHAGSIRVFPNPVRWQLLGKIGIEGLVRDANVKITDVAGRLVRELAAEGGTASWDGRDAKGRLVVPGVYLIFSANADGIEALSGKLAIIR